MKVGHNLLKEKGDKKMKELVKFYNGRIHNRDAARPEVGSIVYKSNERMEYRDSKYELINILVHGGNYDSYVLKNLKTGKQTTSKYIVMPVSVKITDWTAEIKAHVMNGQYSIDFEELRCQLETCGIDTITHALELYDAARAGDINAAHELIYYMLNNNMTGKMENMVALGTSCKLNPACKLNQLNKESVCFHCYAEIMRKTTAYKQALNTYVLCTYVFPYEQIPYMNYNKFRFESFADILNKNQVINYLKIARKNNYINCAIWTKRPQVLHAVIMKDFDGVKPENLSVVVSSFNLNEAVNVKDLYTLKNGADMVNHVFTVYNADYAIENNIKIQCGASRCLPCGLCYSLKTDYYINEILKAEADNYYERLRARAGQ